MNYMSEVAKILGVELGEEFSVGTLGVNYVLTNDGLFYATDRSRCDHILVNILTDGTDINRKPWMPKNGGWYYCIDVLGCLGCEQWFGESVDINYYKLGNCYRTKEEAEANREKWKAFYASDEVLEV